MCLWLVGRGKEWLYPAWPATATHHEHTGCGERLSLMLVWQYSVHIGCGSLNIVILTLLNTVVQVSLHISLQTWIGPVLLCINPFEAPGPAMHSVLKTLCERILQDMTSHTQPKALIFK